MLTFDSLQHNSCPSLCVLKLAQVIRTSLALTCCLVTANLFFGARGQEGGYSKRSFAVLLPSRWPTQVEENPRTKHLLLYLSNTLSASIASTSRMYGMQEAKRVRKSRGANEMIGRSILHLHTSGRRTSS